MAELFQGAETLGSDLDLPQTEFLNAGVAAFLGQTLRGGDVKSVRLSFAIDQASTPDGNMLYRYHVNTSLFDEESASPNDPLPDDHKLANLECEIVCEYAVGAGDPSVLNTPAGFREFIVTRGFPDVFPYLRELTASMSTRLGFGGVSLRSLSLDMIKQTSGSVGE